MRKIMIALLIVGLIITGCGSSKKTTTVVMEPQQQKTQELKRELTLWEGQFNVKYGDPISFFNEVEINTIASKLSYIYKMENGIVKKIPSSKFAFTVPIKTSGIISKNGATTSDKVNVCFFKGSDNYVTFSKRPGYAGFYVGSVATVFVDGIPYTVEINIKGKGDGICRLFFDLQDEENPNNEDKVATGIIPEGTKEIVPK